MARAPDEVDQITLGGDHTVASAGPGAFSPQRGLSPDASGQFSETMRELLRQRLRMASLILFGGFAGFLIRNLLVTSVDTYSHVLIPHLTVTVILGGLGLYLTGRARPTLHQLRVLEAVVFVIPAAFFCWMQYASETQTSRFVPEAGPRSGVGAPLEASQPLPSPLPPPPAGMDRPPAWVFDPSALAFIPETLIPWIMLVHIYGLCIPNTWKRALLVVVPLAIAPLGIAWAVALHREAIRELLTGGGFSAMVLWMSLAATGGVYGSHRFGKLRREAFDAQELGSYRLREKVGEGGMGEVYLAEHRLLKRTCAIKLIKPTKAGDVQALARFEGEVRATAQLTHPNTIEIYDFGRSIDGTFYYVMEFLPGLTLKEIVDRYGPLPPERVVYLLSQVCDALREAHQAELIHRDIKPGNIFAAERGGRYDVAKLLDFGLVKSLHPDAENAHLTIDGAIVGSPAYAAPESTLDNRLDARSDIYSLGATAFYLLTGRAVFEGDRPLKVIFAHANDPAPTVSSIRTDVPADLESIVMRCLEKKPEARFADVSELRDALAACECAGKWSQQQANDWWQLSGERPVNVSDTRSYEVTALVQNPE